MKNYIIFSSANIARKHDSFLKDLQRALQRFYKVHRKYVAVALQGSKY